MPANETTSTATPIPSGYAQARLIRPDGTSSTVNFQAGTTLEVFLQNQGINMADNTIRQNRQPASGSDVVQNGAVVSATPAKVAGAHL